jgi:hypothetical protein
MIKLTSEADIIYSLLNKSLGDSYIKFVVYIEEESNMILEFYSKNFKFTLSRVPDEEYGDKLRVFINGDVYLIPSFNSIDAMKGVIINSINFYEYKLQNFYTMNRQVEKGGLVYIWLKNEE